METSYHVTMSFTFSGEPAQLEWLAQAFFERQQKDGRPLDVRHFGLTETSTVDNIDRFIHDHPEFAAVVAAEDVMIVAAHSAGCSATDFHTRLTA